MPWWTERTPEEHAEHLLRDIRAAEALAAALPRGSRDRRMIEATIDDLVEQLGFLSSVGGATLSDTDSHAAAGGGT